MPTNDFLSLAPTATGLRPGIQWNNESRSQIAKMLMVAHDLRLTRSQSASLYPQQSGNSSAHNQFCDFRFCSSQNKPNLGPTAPLGIRARLRLTDLYLDPSTGRYLVGRIISTYDLDSHGVEVSDLTLNTVYGLIFQGNVTGARVIGNRIIGDRAPLLAHVFGLYEKGPQNTGNVFQGNQILSSFKYSLQGGIV